MFTKNKVSCASTLAVLLVFAVLPCSAQDGKLVIHATPKQASSWMTMRWVKRAAINL